MASPLEDMIEELKREELQSNDGDTSSNTPITESEEEDEEKLYKQSPAEPNYQRNNNDQGY